MSVFSFVIGILLGIVLGGLAAYVYINVTGKMK